LAVPRQSERVLEGVPRPAEVQVCSATGAVLAVGLAAMWLSAEARKKSRLGSRHVYRDA
jgi:hypothetical protein